MSWSINRQKGHITLTWSSCRCQLDHRQVDKHCNLRTLLPVMAVLLPCKRQSGWHSLGSTPRMTKMSDQKWSGARHLCRSIRSFHCQSSIWHFWRQYCPFPYNVTSWHVKAVRSVLVGQCSLWDIAHSKVKQPFPVSWSVEEKHCTTTVDSVH